jgi:hypothetical protein
MTDSQFQFRAGLFAYCHDFHSGQSSRLYRVMSKLNMRLSDAAWRKIRCGKCDPNGEMTAARTVYNQLKRKGAQ